MACGSCGGTRPSSNIEWEVVYSDGTPVERTATLAEARVKRAAHGGRVIIRQVPKR